MAKAVEFAYTARNAKGKVVDGTLIAESRSLVLANLRQMGLSPIDIRAGDVGTGMLTKSFGRFSLEGHVTIKDLSIATRQLATMVAAGLPLVKALLILSNQTDKKRLANALNAVRLDVQSGLTLSAALEKQRQTFPVLMTSLVRAGETGGFLDRALDSLAETFENESKLRNSIRSAMTYPIAVLGMAIVGVIVMLIFIVPIFQKMFEQLGGTLPWPTQMLVILSPIVAWASPFLVVGAIAFSFWWNRNKNAEGVRKIIDPLKLRTPIFGRLFKKIAISRFARNFANMIGAGVPIMQALGVVGQTAGNYTIEKAIERVQESVRLGTTVAQPMASEGIFPLMVTQMISVGEDAGSLEIMLTKLADFYDQEIETTTSQLTSLIEPVMIGFVGVLIGGMIITLYLPIFNIFNVIH